MTPNLDSRLHLRQSRLAIVEEARVGFLKYSLGLTKTTLNLRKIAYLKLLLKSE